MAIVIGGSLILVMLVSGLHVDLDIANLKKHHNHVDGNIRVVFSWRGGLLIINGDIIGGSLLTCEYTHKPNLYGFKSLSNLALASWCLCKPIHLE